MKTSLIKLGETVAVDFAKRGYKGFPRIVIRRKCQVIDHRSNGRVVVQYDDLVPAPGAVMSGASAAPHVESTKLAEVHTAQIVARWDDEHPNPRKVCYRQRDVPPAVPGLNGIPADEHRYGLPGEFALDLDEGVA